MAIRVPNRPPDLSRWIRNADEHGKDETQRKPAEPKKGPREQDDAFEGEERKDQRPESD